MKKLLKRIYKKYKYNKIIKTGIRLYKDNADGLPMLSRKMEDKGRIHIVVNGPSLNDSIGSIKEGEDIIAVNFAIREEKVLKFRPKYYVSIDPFAITKEENLNNIKKLLDDGIIGNYVTNHLTYSIWKKSFGSEKIKLLNQTAVEDEYDSLRDKANYESNKLCPYTGNVAIAALYLALQEGYKEIYLHGNDFTFMKTLFVNEKNEICRKEEHFYGEGVVNLTEITGIDLYGELQAELMAVRGYQQVADYAKDIGANIYNVSKASMLDMFERKTLT